jgi:hypothetical protein
VNGAGLRRSAALFVLAVLVVAAPVSADTAPARTVLDRAVVRFYAPETGGTAHPRFVDQRTLAFEARLESMAERPEGIGDAYQDRHVRAALEHHVGEDMLASLAHKLMAGSPPSRRPSDADLARWFVMERVRAAETAFYQGARTRVVVVVTR